MQRSLGRAREREGKNNERPTFFARLVPTNLDDRTDEGTKRKKKERKKGRSFKQWYLEGAPRSRKYPKGPRKKKKYKNIKGFEIVKEGKMGVVKEKQREETHFLIIKKRKKKTTMITKKKKYREKK
jgi:hypothetical protein